MSDIVQDSSKPTFLYWKLSVRAQTPIFMLYVKIPYQWDENILKIGLKIKIICHLVNFLY